jgi:hypothetical protein
MTQENGNLPPEDGNQIHRSLPEWDYVAQKLEYKTMKELLKHRYHVLRESTPRIAAWFQVNGITITPLRIRQLMRKLKLKRRAADAPHFPLAFWKDVDWTKSNQLIADDKDVDPATVRRWRERLGKTTNRPVR